MESCMKTVGCALARNVVRERTTYNISTPPPS